MSARSQEEEVLLSISEASEEFEIPRIKLYRWMKSGQLHWYKSGRDERMKYVKRDDVSRLLDPRPQESDK